MIKVLQVVSCLALGGTEAFIMNNYRNINREEIQFDFVVFVESEWPYIPEINALGGQVFYVGNLSLKNKKDFFKNLKSVIDKNGPYGAIHCHINIANSWVLYYANRLGIPIRISHSHDKYGKDGNLFVRCYRSFQTMLIKKYATHYLACSEYAGNYLYGKRFFEMHGQIIHNGIKTSTFYNIDASESEKIRKEFQITDQKSIIFGNISRFSDKKNSLFTIDVFNAILKKCPSAILVMGGYDDGLLEAVKQKIYYYGIENNVRLIGPRTDIPVCLSIIDGYIFPSKYEGLPFGLLEAQASGCYCFSSDVVSPETDMGLDTISFYSLDESCVDWADKICRVMSKHNRPNKECIKNQFSNKGYEISCSVTYLINIYTGQEFHNTIFDI